MADQVSGGMDVDGSIAPLLEKMASAMQRIRGELLPLLNTLDEDVVVTNYTLEEQARINLSAAFAIAFSVYALDKLANRQHRGTSAREGNMTVLTGGSTVDAQLVLKIERIMDYIKKLKDLSQLSHAKKSSELSRVVVDESGGAAPVGVSPSLGVKRARDEAVPEEAVEATSPSSGGDMGDAAMFSVVTRPSGRPTATAVGRLMRHVDAVDKEK